MHHRLITLAFAVFLAACGGRPLPEVPLHEDPTEAFQAGFEDWQSGRLDRLLGRLTQRQQRILEDALHDLGQSIHAHTYNTAMGLCRDVVHLWRTRRKVLLGCQAVRQALGGLALRPEDAEVILDRWADTLEAWCDGPAGQLTALRSITLGDIAATIGPGLLQAVRMSAEAIADSGRQQAVMPESLMDFLDIVAAGDSPTFEVLRTDHPNPDAVVVGCNGIGVPLTRNLDGRWVPLGMDDLLDQAKDGMRRLRRATGHRRHPPMLASVASFQLGMLRNAIARVQAAETSAELDQMAQDLSGLIQAAMGSAVSMDREELGERFRRVR